MWLRLVAFFAALSTFTTARADAIYWNYGIASVQVGWSKSNDGPIGYKISFVGIGPDHASRDLEKCIIEATQLAGKFTWVPLDTAILDAPQVLAQMINEKVQLTPQNINNRLKAESVKTGAMITIAEAIYRNHIRNCRGISAIEVDSVQLGIVSRMCVTWAPATEPCKQARAPVGREVDPATGRYAKLYDWLTRNGALRDVNVIVQLVGAGGKIADISPDLRDRAYVDAPSPQQAQRWFEDGAERFRRLGMRYNYVAARVAIIDKSVVLSLLDTVDHPAFIINNLRDDKKQLLSASNEVARIRLSECMYYQSSRTLSEAAKCAGLVFDEHKLRSCLTGDRCVPALAPSASVAALTHTSANYLIDLFEESDLPRISGNQTLKAYSDQARNCSETSSDEEGFGYCLLKSQVSGRTRIMVDCLEQGGLGAATSCVSENLPEVTGSRAARCLLDAKTMEAQSLCLALDKVPEAAAAYQCYQNNKDNEAAALICLSENNLPPRARAAVQCGAQFRGNYESLGACLVTKNLSVDAAKIVNCAAAASGGLAGGVACLAGDSLTAEQRILLECATQSAELISFTTCTGGRLALKEFNQCRDNNFGEGDCFGENNEIRKLSRSLGLGDINGNTVVGKIASMHLDAAKTSVSITEQLLSGGGAVLEGLTEGVATFGEAIIAGVGDHAGNIVGGVGGAVCGLIPGCNKLSSDEIEGIEIENLYVSGEELTSHQANQESWQDSITTNAEGEFFINDKRTAPPFILDRKIDHSILESIGAKHKYEMLFE